MIGFLASLHLLQREMISGFNCEYCYSKRAYGTSWDMQPDQKAKAVGDKAKAVGDN